MPTIIITTIQFQIYNLFWTQRLGNYEIEAKFNEIDEEHAKVMDYQTTLEIEKMEYFHNVEEASLFSSIGQNFGGLCSSG